MKKSVSGILAPVCFLGAIMYLISCEKDIGPIRIAKPEPCLCDTSIYIDPNCPCDEDTIPPPCLCDTTEYKDINCPCDKDTVPYPVCTCDTSDYLDPYCDCDEDLIPHPDFCWCDTTEYIDPNCPCDEDTLMLVSYSRDIQPLWDKYCVECHHEDAETIILTKEWSYSQIKGNSLIYLSQPKSSLIYTITYGPGKEMPPEDEGLNDWEAQVLLWWIEQGALNN